MNTQIWIIIGLFVATDVVLLSALFASLRGHWRRFLDRYPGAFEHRPESAKIVWTMKLGIFNIGGCFRIWSDDAHLHFDPAAIGSWMRLAPVSIPLDQIDIKNQTRSRVTIKTEAGEINLPAKCLLESI